MASQKNFPEEQKIPEGFQIYEERLEVAGVKIRKDEAIAFAESNNRWLELERDEGNKHDKNAIKVIGCSKGFLGTKRRLIGYVPKNVSKLIVERGFGEEFSRDYAGPGLGIKEA